MAELKKIEQQFKGQVTDLNDELLPKDFFLDSLNIRFNTNKDRIQGGFAFEQGTEYAFRLSRIKFFLGENPFIRYTAIDNEYEKETRPIYFKAKDEDGNYSELYKLGQRIPESGEQEVIEVINYETGLILFSTDSKGIDCIWTYDVEKQDLNLEYVRDMGFSIKSPIKAIYNYETELVRKVYWIDGKSQIRFINLDNSIKNQDYENLIDVKLENTNQVGYFRISQPEVEVMSNGGQHTAGTIQYAYNLYKINGNQTKLSPLTRMISLGNGKVSGGNINDKVTDLPKITIQDIDANYTNIRLYAIKYTAFNTVPDIYIVADSKIDDHSSFVFHDTGNLRVQDISLEQMIFIGSDPIYPKEIEAKDNHLFITNYDEAKYTLNNLDMRAFSVVENNSYIYLANRFDIVKDFEGEPNGVKKAADAKTQSINVRDLANSTFTMPDKDMVLMNIQTSLFCADGKTPGMEGKYIRLIMKRPGVWDGDLLEKAQSQKSNLLKDREIYRFAIKFYNGYAQYTDPIYIGDYYTEVTGEDFMTFRTLGNDMGSIIQPKIEIKQAFIEYLNDDKNFLNINGEFDERLKPVGYKLLRASRRTEDRLNVVQGLINPMLSMHPTKNTYNRGPNDPYTQTVYEEGYKMPWLLRATGDLLFPMAGYRDSINIGETNFNPQGAGSGAETFTSVDRDYKKTSHLQFNKMMQLYSPELTFFELNTIDTRRYRVLRFAGHNESSVYGSETNVESKNKDVFVKVTNRLTPRANETDIPGLNPMVINDISGNSEHLMDYGMVGPTNGNSTHEIQFFRDFTINQYIGYGNSEMGSATYESKTLGKPVLVERGQGETSYNGIPLYTFTNKYDRFRTDTPKSKRGTSDPRGSDAILRFNSFNERNITFVDFNQDPIETIVKKFQRTITPSAYRDKMYIPIIEFFRDISYYYTNNMYGGNTGNRQGTEYVEVGDYINLYHKDGTLDTSVKELGPIGDTFYGKFVFQKTSTEETLLTTDAYNAIEIVAFNCETSIDIEKRSDLSIYSWDSFFMPKYKDYTVYNRVYSQQDNIFKNVNDAYNFKSNTSYTNRILATRKKSPGELIDSWTDLSVNNLIDVDGKYGPINAIHTFGQNLLVLQNSAVALVSVNPRVQTIDTDGNSIELGSGSVLHDYTYVTTEYGCIHKWATVTTKNGFYFYDDINKTICLFNGESVIDLCKTKGVNSFVKDIVSDKSFDNNPLLGKGVTAGMDRAFSDVYFVFNNETCIVFNEVLEQFVGRMSYNSPKFSNFGDKTYSVNPRFLSDIHIHSAGMFSEFYGKVEDSYIKFLFNPEPLTDVMLSNISYRLKDKYMSAKYINWNKLRVSNDYQDTGFVNLEPRKNYRVMDRMINITVGRNKGTKERMRDNWHYVEFIKDDKAYSDMLSLNNSFVLTYKPTYSRND